MITLFSAVVTLAAVMLSALALMYCLQALLAILPMRGVVAPVRAEGERGRVGIVVPAHNESAGIGALLAMLREQLREGDRLIVVADNCTDDTAAVARSFGATVLEREHETERGKGYALDHGVRFLERDPPEIVVFLDADSLIEKDTLSVLAETCHRLGRPVQAKYLMTPQAGSRIDAPVACFGLLVKNHVRLLGLRKLGVPSHITGSGFACPWGVIRDVELANGHLAEDKKLGLDLTVAGYPPYYCEDAAVWSDVPYTAKGTRTQRDRWERGHLSLVRAAPRYMLEAFRHRDAGLFLLAIDTAVPPMFLLIFVLAITALVALPIALFGGAILPFWIASLTLCLVLLSTVAIWWMLGRSLLPVRSLPGLLPFVASKIAIYAGGALRSSAGQWIRTDRSKGEN
ncbi:cellulose synthase/poly-beta-1,6-N-acetylglucosamine synthase-like glycosyltransferase [Bosea sp. 124]|nr:cellulose synthase/poly-beta-1,6-N-acetylglucosamine synthase-like glycosyltransferase [Bosea sp. 124]